MTKGMIFLLCLVFFVSGNISVDAQDTRAGQVSIESYKFRTYDGKEYAAELGRLWVIENRKSKSNRLIQLTFVRLKSTAAKPNAPIVFLAGGPGIPGIGLGQVPVYYNLFEKLREVSDVILLDQRGTGMSSPNLQCPAATFPPDVFESADKFTQAYSQFVKTCATHWQAKGVDLSAYNSNQSADDLDDLRRALSVERLSLLGWSYGTELALAAIRRHGKKLDKVVLVSTRGMDNLLKLPSVWDSHIKKLSQLAAEDSAVNKLVPDMESLMKQVFDKLERNPVDLTITDRKTNQQIGLRSGKIGLQTLIRADLSDTRAFIALPALLYTVNQGDYSILTRRMEQLYNGFGSSAMALATDCAAGWSAKRLERANKEAQTAIMSNVNLQWSPDVCKLTGSADLGTNFRSRIKSKVPTLFLSGTLDPNAPPFQAEEARRGFPNSVNLTVENAGHESLPAVEIQAVVVDFFKNQNVGKRAFSLSRPRFISVEVAKLPTSRR
jgi:pimeloyl-ACP methyl ester carboxylesterase